MSVDFRIPEIETERLRMRLPRMDDLPAHAAFRASDRSKGVGGPFDDASSFQHLAGVIGQWQLRGYGRWMVADKVTDEPYGIVGVFHPEEWPEPEIGWSIYANAEGKGIAREAALATREYVYSTLGWDRIVSLIIDGNDRSIRLAERLGCTKDGVFEDAELGKLNIWVHPQPEGRA
ncbi:MAG: GNAT family N-acetyltransferase [Pseudomonadota bacterium]